MRRIVVAERGRPLTFGVDDLMRYHGGGSPAGVAHAFVVLELALPALDLEPVERRELVIRTGFGGPGARDGFELVTRAVTDGRYEVDPALRRPGPGRFVFRLAYRDRTVELALCPGIVSDRFVELAFKAERSVDEQAELDRLKPELAERVLAAAPADVYDVTAM